VCAGEGNPKLFFPQLSDWFFLFFSFLGGFATAGAMLGFGELKFFRSARGATRDKKGRKQAAQLSRERGGSEEETVLLLLLCACDLF
jgi:hypothetical protein